MKEHAVTIYDISKQAGVSIATVSRVLNGSDNVSEATRQKVLKAMEESGYTPNAFARGLGLNTMKTIGIMAADSSDPYLAKGIYFLEQLLRGEGYDCLLCCTGYSLKNRIASMELLITKKVDGIILVGSNFVYEDDADNKYILDAAAQVPVMLLNAALDAPNVYSITSDDYTSMYNAANMLISEGITDILYFFNSRSYSGRRKEAGFRDAMKAGGLSTGDGTLQFYRGNREDVPAMADLLEHVWDQGHHFEAVLASDDTLAISALKFAVRKGLKIPEELSVIGYNNSMLTACVTPELSSIDNRQETLCQHLTATLMGVLGGNEMPKQTVFAGELIRRGTTR
ncbi:MAG: LacI family transcriptional regulator [Lachnospiraceae bacterium]|jgi:LacI family transcriptional regulator/LacI family asc operon transcriptional repressor|nr:LacI family transcriptional regulator [Lachnospiraceae bacterium]